MSILKKISFAIVIVIVINMRLLLLKIKKEQQMDYKVMKILNKIDGD